MNLYRIFVLVSASLLLLTACKSEPIPIEVPAETATVDTTGNGTIIALSETNLCQGEEVSFEAQVLPILLSSCAYSGCHDRATAEEGVVLERYQDVKKEVRSGAPNNSELYESITEDPKDDDFMPPRPADPLHAEQIALIRKWIEQGAKNTTCQTTCNSENYSFANDIFPLILHHCYGCHNASNPLGSINLEDYDHIVTFAANGQLMGSIKHTLGYAAMPPGGHQFTECQIAKIQNWLATGAQNN